MNAVIQDKTMDTEKELIDVKECTERNRKAIPQTVLRALAQRNITLDRILKMTRSEFSKLNRSLFDEKISDDDRTSLIRFKNQSMTLQESLIYEEPTDEEYADMEEAHNYRLENTPHISQILKK